ncbi:MAG: hypothetical protein WD425_21305 [Nitrospirales bacterium]
MGLVKAIGNLSVWNTQGAILDQRRAPAGSVKHLLVLTYCMYAQRQKLAVALLDRPFDRLAMLFEIVPNPLMFKVAGDSLEYEEHDYSTLP